MSAGPDVSVACLWELAELVRATRTCEGGVYRFDSEAALAARNGVLHSSLGADADERIAAVVQHFAARGVPFRWHVGPACRPRDLGERLLANGFHHADTLAGMQSATERKVAQSDSAIRVEPLAAGDEEAFVDVILAGFEAPRSHRDALLTNIASPDPRQTHYVAWVAGAIAGVATSARLARAGFLQGATVLPSHRGRGIYAQLIQARLDDFHAAGIDRAVITARTATAAPICAHLGFEKISEIEIFEHA